MSPDCGLKGTAARTLLLLVPAPSGPGLPFLVRLLLGVAAFGRSEASRGWSLISRGSSAGFLLATATVLSTPDQKAFWHMMTLVENCGVFKISFSACICLFDFLYIDVQCLCCRVFFLHVRERKLCVNKVSKSCSKTRSLCSSRAVTKVSPSTLCYFK